MSNQKNIRTSVDSASPIPTQNHSPDKPYYSLDAFYATLLSRNFKSNSEAISFCRDLCSNHGFTVKQEQSTHKNIYVYCSREGLPDSHRNPKVNPQRNRQSQRCECRWRIVLFENNKETWEFRKSQNADAFVHNHPLLKPDEIKKEWPREVSQKIFELARQRLPTNEIRQQVREQYPDISWDDRRFYNRLSEERQKMKQRDTAMRTIRLVNLSAQICMANAGSEDLSHYVESKLTSLLEDTCKFANVSTSSFAMPVPMPFSNITSPSEPVTPNSIHSSFPVPLHEDIDNRLRRASSLIKTETQKRDNCENSTGSSPTAAVASSSNNNKPSTRLDDNSNDIDSTSKRPLSVNQKKSFENLPKGFLAVPIPEHTLHVKMYSQNSVGDIRRAIFDMQRPTAAPIANNPMLHYATSHREPRRRRSRALFAPEEDNDSMDLDTPARKLSRQVTSSIMDDEVDDMSTQSSPSNSQTMMFTATNTHDINVDHHQLMNYNPRIPPSTSSAAEATTLFYNNSNESSTTGNISTDTNYLHQQPSSFPSADNVYPSASLNATASTRQLPQHIMYDPNSFVNQPQHQTGEMGLIGSPSTPHHVQHERPHSVTFGATIPSVMRAQSVSIPRVPNIDQQPARPLGYPSTFSQLQNIMDENDGKQRYYSSYRDPLQQQQPASPIPPRPSSTPAIPPPPTSTSQMMQHYLPQQQQQQSHQQQRGNEVFASYQMNQSQQPAVFSAPYMTNDQVLQQQQQKRKQQQQQQQQQQQYNLNYRQQQQQEYERQQQQQQHQEQHMYRRASGPN